MSTEANPQSSGPNTSGLKPWRKGQSGNPHGRRAKGLATAERLRNALVDELPAILKSVVTAAKGGDMQAARTILERVLPPLKAIEVPAILEAVSGSLTEQGQAVIQAMTQGMIAPGQAQQILGALGVQAKLVETSDLAERIAAIEARLGANGHAKS